MINILPPELKQSRKYGRLNLFITKQLVGVVIIGALATGVMLSGIRLTQDDQNFLDDALVVKNQAYDEVKHFESQATTLRTKVGNIDKLLEREVKFSKLLVEIGSSIPVGAQLTSLALTGSSTEPLQISATIAEQDLAGVLRKNLVDSGIFESADILSVSLREGGEGEKDEYVVSLNASLSGSTEKVRSKSAADAAAAKTANEITEQEGS